MKPVIVRSTLSLAVIALLQAGVPSYKIQTGAFGDPLMQRDGRVEVLVSAR